ncbi:MAG: tubulin-like doman-containing protein [Capsulimonadaceae bacterium]
MTDNNSNITNGALAASTVIAQVDEGRLRGISRSVIVGVGGTGHQIILDVRKRLIEKYGSLAKIPIVGFALVDTDQAIFSRNPDYDDAVNLDSADKVHASVHGVDNLRKNLRDHPHLRTWLDPRVLTGDIDQGAGAVRARGRLAYFWNYQAIARKLEDEIHMVTRDSSKETAIRNGLQVGEGITVYVVGSLLGGTGSGMFLDLAYTVRNKFRSLRMLEMVGMFSIPPNTESVAVDNRPNAYAALLELNHFTDPSTTFTSQYQPDIPPIEEADPPFRYTYLVDTSSPVANLDSVKDLVEMIGHSIFLDLTSEFQRQKKSNRNNFDQFLITSDGLGCPQNYMGFGLSSIHFPKDKVIAACSNRLAADLVRRWTEPIAPPSNLTAFSEQELTRLGLTPDAVMHTLGASGGTAGETLRDTALAYWGLVNRQYESAYPGHTHVVEYLTARQKEADARLADTDPNPDLLAKRKNNVGESVYQVQQNLVAALAAKDDALRAWVSACVNDIDQRHGTALRALDLMADSFRSYIEQVDKKQADFKGGLLPIKEARAEALVKIHRIVGEPVMGLILAARRREIDGLKDAFLTAARRHDGDVLDMNLCVASVVLYRHLLETVVAIKADMDRFVERMDALKALFSRTERNAVLEPVDVNGEVLFNPGRREVDNATGQERYVEGDIDDRYAHYAGNPLDPSNAAVNNLAVDILDTLGTPGDIWGVRDADLQRAAGVIRGHAQAVFAAVEEESVLDKFFRRYPPEADRTVQTLRRVVSLSQPFLHLQENAPNYTHNINKEQTIVGVLHGAAPRSESEQRFMTMIMDTVQGVKDQQITNSNEAYQVLFLHERAAFPLRLLQGMESYRYAYDQFKSQGSTANPVHTRTDIKEWIRISPPSAEEQKDAWRTFVVGWASGVIAEEHESRYTSIGTRDVVSFTAHYTDKFGMPKSDGLGGFTTIESVVAGYKPESGAAGRPPAEARDIIQRLCDDRRMAAQINAAVDESLRAEGAPALGARLVQHANAHKPGLDPAFYDSYYAVLTGYLEEINYEGGLPVAVVSPSSSGPQKPAAPVRTVRERLAHLKELLDEGLITQDDHDRRKKEILAEV